MLLNIESVPSFYRNYIRQVPESDLLAALRASGNRAQELVASIPEDKGGFRYAEGKWSIREVLCHLLDGERVFAYRALRFARNDRTPLPGYEQDDYAPQANASARTLKRLAEEMARLRASTIDLFEGFTPEMLARRGVANQAEITVLAIGCIIAGHERHHIQVLKERYLNP